MHKYSVTEVMWTIQGEGYWAGTATAFLRLSGCNLWSGKEEHRATALCQFCDTDFAPRFSDTAEGIADRVAGICQNGRLVITGGEPLLQLDLPLLSALRKVGVSFIAVETNGTVMCKPGVRESVDWLTVSPKCNFAGLSLKEGHELKIVYPDRMGDLWQHVGVGLEFQHYFIQPCDGPDYEFNLDGVVKYAMQYPRWRISLQQHKIYRCDPVVARAGE